MTLVAYNVIGIVFTKCACGRGSALSALGRGRETCARKHHPSPMKTALVFASVAFCGGSRS